MFKLNYEFLKNIYINIIRIYDLKIKCILKKENDGYRFI